MFGGLAMGAMIGMTHVSGAHALVSQYIRVIRFSLPEHVCMWL